MTLLIFITIVIVILSPYNYNKDYNIKIEENTL